jgi:hypothetical protein
MLFRWFVGSFFLTGILRKENERESCGNIASFAETPDDIGGVCGFCGEGRVFLGLFRGCN